jgi:DNA-binding CsgD family transcriptional regulator
MSYTQNSIHLFHHIDRIDDDEYRKSEDLIEAFRTFAQLTYCWVYILDHYEDGFRYVSEHPTFLCGHSAEEVKDMGYEFFKRHIPAEEFRLLQEMHKAIDTKMNGIEKEKMRQSTISYNFHLTTDDTEQLVFLKATSIAFDKEGNSWLVACVLSPSPHSSFGHAFIRHRTGRNFSEYSFGTHRWEERTLELTEREKEILLLTMKGHTIGQIASELCLSAHAVKYHRMHIYEKLGVENMAEALAVANNYGLL